MTQRLTQTFVDQASADGRDRIVFDNRAPGLGLRITPTGTKIFVAQARVLGRKRRITIGYASGAGGMSLAKARTEALHTLLAMRQGGRPHRRAKGASTGLSGPKHNDQRVIRAVDGRACHPQAQAADGVGL